MAYLPTRSISIGDGANLDAFSRLRVSEPAELFSSSNEYDTGPLVWSTAFTGAGSSTHLPNESAVSLATGSGSSGDRAIRQTKEYVRYQPGKSQLFLATFVLGAAKANVRRRVGLYEASNGIFLEQTISGLSIVRRTFTSGVVVDVPVAQANWNIDPMLGSGPSGVLLDPTKSQILLMDLEWLGVGRVRVGFVVDGKVYYAHEFLNTNSLDTVYMTTANLPVRAEIENTGAASGTSTMKFVCASVSSEGGYDEDSGYPFAYANPANITVSATPTVLIILRPKTTFGTKTNRGQIVLNEVALQAAADTQWSLIYDPTVAGGSWADVNGTHSMAEVNITGTISGGFAIATGFCAASGGTRGQIATSIRNQIHISNGDVAGVAPTAVALVGTAFTGTNASRGALLWSELR